MQQEKGQIIMDLQFALQEVGFGLVDLMELGQMDIIGAHQKRKMPMFGFDDSCGIHPKSCDRVIQNLLDLLFVA